ELVGEVEHRRHLVGAVAVDVHQDVAVDDAGQGVELEVALAAVAVVAVVLGLRRTPPAALLRLGLLALAAVLLQVFGRLDEGGAVAGDVAHAGRGAALLAIYALGVLAAGHLHAPGRARELHGLVGRGRHVLQRDAAPADQVGRAGQD